MYFEHFGLVTQPFGVTPDPSFLYESAAHREALASLVNSIESGLGFSSLIGDPGLGKTTLLYTLLERYSPTSRTAFVFTARSRGDELLRQILDDFEVSTPNDDVNAMYRSFRDMLVAEASSGRRVILFLDEAQALSASALNAIRLLSNFETRSSKLLHIVIAGQSELDDTLNQPKLAALRQRISKAARLRPLTFGETRQYIEHRLQLAGAGYSAIFTPGASNLIAEKSGGIPRSINRICMNAMTIACGLNSSQVNEAHVHEALDDLESPIVRPSKPETGPVLVTPSPAPVVSAPAAASTHTWGSQALAIVPVAVPKPSAGPAARDSKPAAEPTPPPPMPIAEPTTQLPVPVATSAPPSPVPVEVIDPVLALRLDVRSHARTELVIPLPVPDRRRSYIVLAMIIGILLSAFGIAAVMRSSRSKPEDEVVQIPTPAVLQTLPQAPSIEELLSSKAPAETHRHALRTRTSPSARTDAPSNERVHLSRVPARPMLPVVASRGSFHSASADDRAARITIKAAHVERSGNVPHITPAVLLVRTKPEYPEEARAEKLRGEVRLRLHVDKTGHVSSVIVLSGDHRLADSAESAVRQWVFTPFQQDGIPLAGDTTVAVQFPPAD